MAQPPIIISIDRLGRFRRSMAKLGRKRVSIGFVEGRTEGVLTNAQIAYIHEYGSPARNIPARPFLLPGVREVRFKITALMARAALASLAGNEAEVLRLYHAIGLLSQTAVKRKIVAGPFAPLSPVTIAKRKRKGRQPPYKPLIDTAQMLNAVTYVIADGATRR